MTGPCSKLSKLLNNSQSHPSYIHQTLVLKLVTSGRSELESEKLSPFICVSILYMKVNIQYIHIFFKYKFVWKFALWFSVILSVYFGSEYIVRNGLLTHYIDVTMNIAASHITGNSRVSLQVCSGVHQWKHHNPRCWSYVRGIDWWQWIPSQKDNNTECVVRWWRHIGRGAIHHIRESIWHKWKKETCCLS